MDILQQLQKDIAGYLGSEMGDKLAAYHYVPIHIWHPREDADAMLIEQEIDQALSGLTTKNGKAGLAATVLMPEVNVPLDRVKGPLLEVECTVRLIEMPLVNMGAEGAGTTAEQIAMDSLSALHFWTPGRVRQLRGKGRGAMKAASIKDRPDLIAWDVNVITEIQIVPTDAASAPAIELQGELPDMLAILTTPDAGAAIRYSLDGSFPSLVYTDPVEITQACTLRAIALLTGYLPSHITEERIGA